MKDEVPKLLKLVDSMPYNFEDEDAEKEAKLYHNRLKERARQVRQRDRTVECPPLQLS